MEIHRVQVPAPMEIGDVNCFIVRSDKTMVVDPGPADDETFKAFAEGLKDLGLEFEDIDYIVITHPHSDHFGNAAKIQEKSGAEIMAHEDAVWILENFEEYGEKFQEYFGPYMEDMGFTEVEAEEVMDKHIPNQFVTSLDIGRSLEDGEIIDIGEEVEVIFTPGHARGSICLKPEKDLIAGDTVLVDITPNPVLQLPSDGKLPPASLVMYLESLKRLQKLDLDRLYCGHHEPVENPQTRISEIINHHRERKEDVMDIIEHPMTAREIMDEMFPWIDTEEYFLGLSETIGHLRLLENEGRVERESRGLTYFRSVNRV